MHILQLTTVAKIEACILTASGLDKSPEILQDTMSSDVSPESAAGSAVVVNRGYNQDRYAVSWLVSKYSEIIIHYCINC